MRIARNISLSLLLFCGVSVICGAVDLYSHLQEHDEVYVRQITRRTERSADEGLGVDTEANFTFPQKMEFTFTVNGKRINLYLRLNEKQRSHVSVNLVTKTGISQYRDESQRDYAFYQVLDETVGAAVMVRCVNFTFPCHIVGSFQLGDEEYLIEPNTDKPKLVSKVAHKIYKMPSQKGADAYKGDTVVKTAKMAGNIRALNKGPNDNLQERRKRQTFGQVNHKVELEMVIDYSIYYFWLQRHGFNVQATIETIKEYYEQVANGMDIRYTTATTNYMTIYIIPLQITIIQNNNQNAWITSNLKSVNGAEVLDSPTALDDFENWVRSNKGSMSSFDSVMVFTRKNLAAITNSITGTVTAEDGTVGLAQLYIDDTSKPLSALCGDKGSWDILSVSIIEDVSAGDASRTAAHELAHTMGVQHDNILGCDPWKYNIMAPGQSAQSITKTIASNPWTFSSCSVSVMEITMDRLLNEYNGVSCLQSHTFDVNDYNRILNSKLLGEIYSLDEQCRIIQGQGSYKCRIEGLADEDVCFKGMYCYVPGTASQCFSTDVMPGSACGTGMCDRGRCVQRVSTTIMSTTTTTRPTTTTTTPTTTTTKSTTTTTKPTTTTTKPTTTTTKPTTTTTKPTTTTKSTPTVTKLTKTTTKSPTTPSTPTATTRATKTNIVPTNTATTPTSTIKNLVYCIFWCQMLNWLIRRH